MSIFTKINGLKAFLTGVCMLLIFNVLLNYKSYISRNYSTFSKLSIQKTLKYTRIFNHSRSNTSFTVSSSFERNSTVYPYLIVFPQNFIQTQRKNFSRFSDGNSSISAFTQHDEPRITPLPNCKPPTFDGGEPVTPNTTLESLDVVEAELGPLLQPGGAFQPKDCISKQHVAIVVPFRDRYAHLSVFLRNIHPFLMKQRIAYRIFIVQQTNGKPFNRASLMNIGFLEALKIFPWDCFIFHDVDLLPLDNRNFYNCPNQPRHMSVSIDTLNFKLPYRSIFGGVSAMTREQFQTVNGFSNSYYGWGGEDDDMSNRLKHANLFISRYPLNIARYMMLKHQKEKANPNRYENLVNGIGKIELDGLNSIKYKIHSIKEFPVFTWYLAELKMLKQKC